MPTVTIEETGCRGCTLCADICPVDVFDINEEKNLAEVSHGNDCIGCMSCYYQCPSQCIAITDVKLVKPFHRIEKDVAFVEQFVQTPAASNSILPEEWETAYREVGLLLTEFSSAISEILGRGHKSVGRRAGLVAAAHLPEMYEQKDLNALLARMKERFGSSFDFDYTLSNGTITLSVKPCGLQEPLKRAGQQPGKSDLCLLFHEYWAGLLCAFTGRKYGYEVRQAGDYCTLVLQIQER